MHHFDEHYAAQRTRGNFGLHDADFQRGDWSAVLRQQARSALLAASTWALGTQLLRRTQIPVPTLAIWFWMTVLTAVFMTLLALVFERHRFVWPSPLTWASIVFNAVLIFGFAHATWFYLARSLPPVASTLSVMMIPIIGVFSGAIWLGEKLFWQDWAAVALMVVAIASVLWPKKP